MKDNGGPSRTDGFRNPVAPMRYKYPLRIGLRNGWLVELILRSHRLDSPIESLTKTISQGSIPGSTGEQQWRSLLKCRDVAHLKHVSESRSAVRAQAFA